jgi:hypothetical protein
MSREVWVLFHGQSLTSETMMDSADTLYNLPPVEPPPTAEPTEGLSTLDQAAEYLHTSGLAEAVLTLPPEHDPRTEGEPEPLPPFRPDPEPEPEPEPAPTADPALADTLPPDQSAALRDFAGAQETLAQLTNQYHATAHQLEALRRNRAALVAEHGAAQVVAEEARLEGALYELDLAGRQAQAVGQQAHAYLNQTQVQRFEARRQAERMQIHQELQAEFGQQFPPEQVFAKARELALAAGLTDAQAEAQPPEMLRKLGRHFCAQAEKALVADERQAADRSAAARRAAETRRERAHGWDRYGPSSQGMDEAARTFRKLGIC